MALRLSMMIAIIGCNRSGEGTARNPLPLPLIELVWSTTGEASSFSRFGSAVATGDVNHDRFPDLLVAASAFNTGRANAGKVYLYLGTASGLSDRPVWSDSGENVEGAYFGSSLALVDLNGDGFDDAVIAAPNHRKGESGAFIGRVYIYPGGPAGLGSQPIWVSSGEEQVGAFFGASIADAGDVNGDRFHDLLVGASGYQEKERAVGKAYLYLGGGNGPGSSPVWTSMGDRAPGSGYGFKIAGAGDINRDGYADVLVAAPRLTGKVFLYSGSAGGLSEAPSWVSSGDRQGGAAFGLTLAPLDANGDRLIDLAVGAYFQDTPGHTDAGKAFFFPGSRSGFSKNPSSTSSGDDLIDAKYGTSVTTLGDINQDGYDDLLIGSKQKENGRVQSGKVFLYLGGPKGLAVTPAWTSSGENRERALFGDTAALLVSKRFTGFLVGAPTYSISEGQEEVGKVYLYRIGS